MNLQTSAEKPRSAMGYIRTPEWDSDLLTYAGSHGSHVPKRRCSTRRNYANTCFAVIAVDVA
jgi:hypothetical protein